MVQFAPLPSSTGQYRARSQGMEMSGRSGLSPGLTQRAIAALSKQANGGVYREQLRDT